MKCDTTRSDMYLQDNKCTACTTIDKSCTSCESPGKCTQCEEKMFLRDNKCFACTTLDPKCKTCNNEPRCVECESRYFVNQNNQCRKCAKNCLSCYNDYSCRQCEEDYEWRDGGCNKVPFMEKYGKDLEILFIIVAIVAFFVCVIKFCPKTENWDYDEYKRDQDRRNRDDDNYHGSSYKIESSFGYKTKSYSKPSYSWDKPSYSTAQVATQILRTRPADWPLDPLQSDLFHAVWILRKPVV